MDNGLGGKRSLSCCSRSLVILLRLGVAGEDESAPVVGGEVNVQHLDGGELFRHGARRQSWRQRAQALLQRYLEAIGQKGHEDVRLDAPIAGNTHSDL